MPPIATIAAAKLVLKASRALGRGGGSALPGLMAERVDPNIGYRLARRLPQGSIVITGTNGKTTTAKMLARIFEDSGEQLVTNRAGSNLSRGIVSALIEHVGANGRFGRSLGLFEVDEGAMPAVAAMLEPKAIMVLNLFRDQLDRYGELDTTAAKLGQAIAAATNAIIYLNADDPLVASLASYADPKRVRFFGIDAVPTAKLAHDVTADSLNCPVCGRTLHYKVQFFGHVGHYRCPEGHFDRPTPSVRASKVELGPEDSSFELRTSEDEVTPVQLKLPGLYNIYNALAAASVATDQGLTPAHIAQSLERTEAAFGRVEKLQLGDHTIYLLLVKNPTGFNQVIQTFLLQKEQQNLLIAINDNLADGRDVSWLWDVAFEEMQPQNHRICVSGVRATDMALRLKYADIPVAHIESSLKTALNQFVAQLPPGGTGYIMPTYTAMLALRRVLGRKAKLKGEWQ